MRESVIKTGKGVPIKELAGPKPESGLDLPPHRDFLHFGVKCQGVAIRKLRAGEGVPIKKTERKSGEILDMRESL